MDPGAEPLFGRSEHDDDNHNVPDSGVDTVSGSVHHSLVALRMNFHRVHLVVAAVAAPVLDMLRACHGTLGTPPHAQSKACAMKGAYTFPGGGNASRTWGRECTHLAAAACNPARVQMPRSHLDQEQLRVQTPHRE